MNDKFRQCDYDKYEAHIGMFVARLSSMPKLNNEKGVTKERYPPLPIIPANPVFSTPTPIFPPLLSLLRL